MEELLCPVISNITPEVKVWITDFYEQKQQAESDTDYESEGETVECCRVGGRTIPRVWTHPRVQEHNGSGSNIIRRFMWNHENLAQRLDLDKVVSKREAGRDELVPITISPRGVGTQESSSRPRVHHIQRTAPRRTRHKEAKQCKESHPGGKGVPLTARFRVGCWL